MESFSRRFIDLRGALLGRSKIYTHTHLPSCVATKNVVRIYTGESCLAVFFYLLSELIETPVVEEHSKEFNFRKIAWET